MSQTIKDIVITMKGEEETAHKLLNSSTFNDLPLAISHIFSIRESPYLQTYVCSSSTSFKMARLYTRCMTFYWSAIVTIHPSRTIFEIFDVEYYRDVELSICDLYSYTKINNMLK